jgi:ATP-binding cassette subfamily F protein 3
LSQLELSEKTAGSEPAKKISSNKMNWEKRKDFEKELRKIQNLIIKSESEIGRLETEIKKTEEMLIQPEKFKDKILGSQLYNEYEKSKSLLDKEMKKWENLHLELEEIEKKNPDKGI